MSKLIIDSGSYSCKFGLASEKAPIEIQTISLTNEDSVPLNKGIVKDWNGMQKIWLEIFTKTGVKRDTCDVVLTAPFYPRFNREKITEIMFETMKVQNVFICTDAYMLSLNSGHKIGIVVSSGESATRITPIINGEIDKEAIRTFDLAGGDITKYLSQSLGIKNEATALENFRKFKEKHCYVIETFDDTVRKKLGYNKSYVVSPICKLRASTETYSCTEGMFTPNTMEKEFGGLQEAIFNSIMVCDDSHHETLIKNIILCGGNTMFRGFRTRLTSELSKQYKKVYSKSQYNCKIVRSEKFQGWLGGYYVSNKLFIDRSKYEEVGINIVDDFIN